MAQPQSCAQTKEKSQKGFFFKLAVVDQLIKSIQKPLLIKWQNIIKKIREGQTDYQERSF